MPLTIAVSRERAPGESRVALVPETAKKFRTRRQAMRMEQSAGIESHMLDSDYADVSMVNGISEAYGAPS
jgi:NAD(P) transhydrogenase subunit alpha